jgi:hypothetical protein
MRAVADVRWLLLLLPCLALTAENPILQHFKPYPGYLCPVNSQGEVASSMETVSSLQEYRSALSHLMAQMRYVVPRRGGVLVFRFLKPGWRQYARGRSVG